MTDNQVPEEAAMEARKKASHGQRSFVQFRPKGGDGEGYNPQRDIAVVFPSVLSMMVRSFSTGHWPELLECATKAGDYSSVEQAFEQIDVASGILHAFAAGCVEDPQETYGELVTRVGWMDLPTATRYAVLAMVGEKMMGVFFVGVREMVGVKRTTDELNLLMDAADNARRLGQGLARADDAKTELVAAVKLALVSGVSKEEIKSMMEGLFLE